ncbi:MAG: ACP S-malonyltransferase [Desulfobacterales bacterium]|nr:ACP S-malonyltransferase [Desulfobacterales bacterium]MCP4160599.1 ACP S-malonyltransferase [Deltaproteobacteria bacterium]
MKKKIVFMYSGQGSQYFQMGKQLFEQNHAFKKWVHKLDEIVQDYLKKSIVNIIYNDGYKKSEMFDRTLYSSPAIFIIEYALTQVLLENNIKPDFVMGSSLGELCSAAIAGVVNVEDGIKAVIKQAQILEKNCEKGGMLAILHKRELFDKIPFINENSEFASDNFHSHFVISGKVDKLKEIEIYLREKQINFQPLPVTKAFHSSLIDSAFADYSKILNHQKFLPPNIPLISCLYSKEIMTYSTNYFWDVIRYPILFQKTIKNLEHYNDYIYLDMGPSGTLANFAKYNLKTNSGSETYAILTPFGQDMKNLENITKKLKKNQYVSNKSEAKKMIKTYVFPGQGAQKKGMGGNLFDEYKELTKIADNVLGYSIKELCIENRNNLLGNTKYTQPALYVVNALSYLRKIEDSGYRPDFVAGHSLGEYNALFAAGAFNFETGLRIVKKRGELMGDAHGGGMAAIIGLNSHVIENILSENNFNNISIANFNTPSQIVVAGLKEDINNAKKIFEEAGARMYIPLNVSGAFHSQYMASAKEEFKSFLNDIDFSEIKIPVISNTHARPYEKEKIKENLTDQITHSVKWTESICYLMGKGKMEFEEVGPGNVLTGLIRQIEKEGTPIIEDAEEIENNSENAKKVEESEKNTNILSKTEINESEVKNNVTAEVEPHSDISINAESLGCDEFKKDYNVKYSYVAGGMYKGISSDELVIKIGKAGMLGYFGTGGLGIDVIEKAIKNIQEELIENQAYGMNLINGPLEELTVDLFLKHNVRNVEAAAYMQITPALVKYRLKGLSRNGNNGIIIANRIQAKISRPEVATIFLSPAPERIINKLLETNQITQEEAELSKNIPMADDICAESDSGGHTDQAVAYALLPAIMRLRDEMMEQYNYEKKIRVGAAGGIGTPEAAAAAFIMGADFILTGSINQCTVEAGTSDSVKELLQQINVQDTEYAPAGDMFEFGAKVQVLKKGVFFPARANKLYSLYQHYDSLDKIDEKTKKQIEERYFKRSFDEIFEDCKDFYPAKEIEIAEKNQKNKMAMIFKWYFGLSTRLAMDGNEERRVDYQIQCGPALGAFNQWVKGTPLEDWKKRHVDEIGVKLMKETSSFLFKRLRSF